MEGEYNTSGSGWLLGGLECSQLWIGRMIIYDKIIQRQKTPDG
jgi:hypothetical protein